MNHDEDLRFLFTLAAQPRKDESGTTKEANHLIDCVLKGLMCKFTYAACVSEVRGFWSWGWRGGVLGLVLVAYFLIVYGHLVI